MPVLIPIRPGTYEFELRSSGVAGPDPLGSQEFFQVHLDMHTVPDTGSTLVLMLGGFAVLLVAPFQYRVQRVAR